MDIGAIGKMLGMARGQENLDQGCAQGAEQQAGKPESDVLKKLMEMLSGGGGTSGAECAECQKSPEELEKLAAGRQGLEAMMPGDDSGRQINV